MKFVFPGLVVLSLVAGAAPFVLLDDARPAWRRDLGGGADLGHLLAGNMYFNVHTNDGIAPDFPGGEIRGQLAPVPEPGTLALTGAALAGVLAYRRRRAAKTA